MSKSRGPILKRCRYLGISPSAIGVDKESNRKKNAGRDSSYRRRFCSNKLRIQRNDNGY